MSLTPLLRLEYEITYVWKYCVDTANFICIRENLNWRKWHKSFAACSKLVFFPFQVDELQNTIEEEQRSLVEEMKNVVDDHNKSGVEDATMGAEAMAVD